MKIRVKFNQDNLPDYWINDISGVRDWMFSVGINPYRPYTIIWGEKQQCNIIEQEQEEK